MTGPSFTSASVMRAWNRPVSTVAPAARAAATKRSYSARATGAGAAVGEGGAAAVTAVGVQRELRHHEERSADVVQRAVHLSGVVVEDAQPEHLAAEELGLRRRVTRRDAHQNAETVADGADHLAVDRRPALRAPVAPRLARAR